MTKVSTALLLALLSVGCGECGPSPVRCPPWAVPNPDWCVEESETGGPDYCKEVTSESEEALTSEHGLK